MRSAGSGECITPGGPAPATTAPPGGHEADKNSSTPGGYARDYRDEGCDQVLYSKYGGTEVKYGGEEYLVLSARDVLAVIEK